MTSIILKPGHEKSLLRQHPWIFSGAIANVEGAPQAGETVAILASDGRLLARGAFSPHSQITVRVWTFAPEEEISPEFFRARLTQALRLRTSLCATIKSTALRIVNAESDGLPGLIVDRYNDVLVCQFLSAGVEYWKPDIVRQLQALFPEVAGIYERSDMGVREKEGLPQITGVLVGQEPPDGLKIQEDPCFFWVDVKHGQKTGFYLDQRENRTAVAEYASDAEVLNCFAYTGGFGIWALKHGAQKITNIESSAPVLELAQRNIELNGLSTSQAEQIAGNVFQVLRQYRESGRQFDLIVLDPPKFVESRGQLKRASRGYKDINLLAFKLLKPGGILFTFSCSGLMPPELFQKIVADAALDAGRSAQIIRRLSQAADHPTALSFPEGNYLKGLICKVA